MIKIDKGVGEKTTISVWKEIVCSKCQEHYKVRIEPIINHDGIIGYLRDIFIDHVCPACGHVDRG